jgi:AraC family transcriptional regulator
VTSSRDATHYFQRLERVAAYLEAHLADTLDLNALADVAHLSPYHFHRIYHAIVGETLAATVRRLRLQRAAGYLAQTSRSIADIARATGYDNVQSFTRIFKTQYGIPPAQYRSSGTHTRFRTTASSQPQLLREVRVLETEAMTGVSVEHRGSYLLIERAFNTLYRWAGARNLLGAVRATIGMYDDDPFSVPEKQLRSRACLMLESDSLPESPFPQVNLPRTLCAVIRHQGPYADMRSAYQWLYGRWLPNSGYEAADAPVFEVYLNHPRDTPPPELLVDIHLPLRPPRLE